MRRLLPFLFGMLVVTAAHAAGPVYQGGNVTPGHVAMWSTNGVVQDGGTAATGALTSLGLTSANSCSVGINSGSITAAYSQLCFGVNPTAGAGVISLTPIGGATPLPLELQVGGTTVLTATSAGASLGGTVTLGNLTGSTQCLQVNANGVVEVSGIGACGSGGGGVFAVQDFLAGHGFTPGTTTSITLTSAPANASALSLYFDGVRQSSNTWSLTGAVVTFNAPIPTAVQVVEAQWGTAPGIGVTSVALSMPAPFTVSGTPVTGIGTLSVGLVSEAANEIWASPNGTSGAPSFRALATSDLPASGVSAGNYTNANITVDAQGTITSATSGSASGNNLGALPSITSYDPACGTGTHDCTAAITSALASGKPGVYFPPGIYYEQCGQTINVPGFQFVGAGEATYNPSTYTGSGYSGTLIVCTTAANPFLTIGSGVNWVYIGGLTETRNVTATSGGDGIDAAGDTEQTQISDVFLDSNYKGMSLGTTQHSEISNIWIQNSVSDALDLTNTAGVEQIQWQINHFLAQENGGDAIKVTAVAGQPGAILGAWNDVQDFANTAGGINLIGNATTYIADLRINGCFLGSDGYDEIHLAYVKGQANTIANCTIERAGMDATGPNGGTAASNQGNGIYIDGNSTNVQINNVNINVLSWDGIISFGSNTIINSSAVWDAGEAASTGSQVGVSIQGGNAIITGLTSGNTAGNSSQQYGIGNSGTIDLLAASNLVNNTAGNYSGTAPVATCGAGYTCSGAGGGLTVGSTTIASGTSGYLLYNNAGTLGNEAASSLATTINGTACYLTQTCSITATAGSITVGTTSVSSGTAGALLLNNGGTLGNAAPVSSGDVLMDNGVGANPSFQQLYSSAVYGATSGGNAAAGILGEYISSNVPVASAVPLTSLTPANITSISLTAGDWDVCGNIGLTPGASTTISSVNGWISTTSGANPTHPNGGADVALNANWQTGVGEVLPVGCTRINVSATTTVYLETNDTFATSTLSAYGFIGARRAR